MTILALILALAAVLVFLLAPSFNAGRDRVLGSTNLGLALLTLAWIVQLFGWTQRVG